MRLSGDRQKKLTGMIWMERLKKALPVILIALVLGGGAIYLSTQRAARQDKTVEVKDHKATILALKRPRSRGAAIVTARLDDGRVVDALSQLNDVLVADEEVTIAEGIHASGRHTYDVIRVGP